MASTAFAASSSASSSTTAPVAVTIPSSTMAKTWLPVLDTKLDAEWKDWAEKHMPLIIKKFTIHFRDVIRPLFGNQDKINYDVVANYNVLAKALYEDYCYRMINDKEIGSFLQPSLPSLKLRQTIWSNFTVHLNQGKVFASTYQQFKKDGKTDVIKTIGSPAELGYAQDAARGYFLREIPNLIIACYRAIHKDEKPNAFDPSIEVMQKHIEKLETEIATLLPFLKIHNLSFGVILPGFLPEGVAIDPSHLSGDTMCVDKNSGPTCSLDVCANCSRCESHNNGQCKVCKPKDTEVDSKVAAIAEAVRNNDTDKLHRMMTREDEEEEDDEKDETEKLTVTGDDKVKEDSGEKKVKCKNDAGCRGVDGVNWDFASNMCATCGFCGDCCWPCTYCKLCMVKGCCISGCDPHSEPECQHVTKGGSACLNRAVCCVDKTCATHCKNKAKHLPSSSSSSSSSSK